MVGGGSLRNRAYCSYSGLTYTSLSAAPPNSTDESLIMDSQEFGAVIDDPYNMRYNFDSGTSRFFAFRVNHSGLYSISTSVTTHFDSSPLNGLLTLKIVKRDLTNPMYGIQTINGGEILASQSVSGYPISDGFITTYYPTTGTVTVVVSLQSGDEVYPDIDLLRYSTFGVTAVVRNLAFSLTEVTKYIDRSTT